MVVVVWPLTPCCSPPHSSMRPLDTDPVAAVAELERAVTKLGCIALRIIPWLWNLPPNNKLYYPLYVKCVQLGIPFCTQVGHTGPLLPSDVGRPIPYIDEIALAFPDLVIVGGHTGYPWTDEMIALAWKYKNVYIDTSAFMPAYYPPQLVHFMQTYGRKKVRACVCVAVVVCRWLTTCAAHVFRCCLRQTTQC